jgi:serine/threonine protein kinase
MRQSAPGSRQAEPTQELPTRPRGEPALTAGHEASDLTDLSKYLRPMTPGSSRFPAASERGRQMAPLPRTDLEQLGSYFLLTTIGQGGMSEVYLAAAQRPGGFTKLLVLKELRSSLTQDPEFLQMFLAEARLAARLQHPNVVQTYEVGESNGRHFIAMEYLEGQPLHRILSLPSESGGIGMAARLTIMAEMLDGLHYAHEATDFDGSDLGVIHRDVTPHNVFVTYRGEVKIMDFGVAKVAQDHHHTTAGVLKGKLGYMSPEQARGEPLDRRADVFSAGVVLWECLTGKRMWEGVAELDVLRRLADGQLPSLEQMTPAVPAELVTIWQRACAAEVERRYPTALSLQADLWDYLDSIGGRVELRGIGEQVAAAFSQHRHELRSTLRQRIRLLPREGDPAPRLQARHNADTAPPTHREPLSEARLTAVDVSSARTPLAATTPLPLRLTREPARWPWLATSVAAVGLGVLLWGLLEGRRPPVTVTTDTAQPLSAQALGAEQFAAQAGQTQPGEKPLVELSGDIEGAARLTADKDYLLKFLTYVRPGATLSIEPGTRILGDRDTKGTLVVQPGGRLLAVGTPERPIVFTSERPEGARKPGDWGGVILLGNAPTNLRTADGSPKRGRVEGITQGGTYGGTDANDNSGSLSYVRIEYAGTELGPNNEINGLTLAGVGRGTKLNHIEVRAAADDCFEFFGGTVDAHHLICQGTGDDAFDWDNGYAGRLQFLVAVFDPREVSRGNGFEGDNDAEGSLYSPVSRPTIYNATLCGAGRADQVEHYGVVARRSTQGLLANSLITDFSAAVDLRDAHVGFAMVTTQVFRNLPAAVAFPESPAATRPELLDDDRGMDEAAWFMMPGRHNRVRELDLDCGLLRGQAPKPPKTVSELDGTPPADGFFDPTATFRGAFRDPLDDWDQGWAVWTAP